MLSSIQYEVAFTVRGDVFDKEAVYVTGDCEELGCWNPHRAVQLRRKGNQEGERGSQEKQGQVWSRNVKFTANKFAVKYRYFIGRVFHSENEDDEKSIIITRWETNIKPRIFSLKDIGSIGEKTEPEVQVFGDYDGYTCTSFGWLIEQSQITISLHSNPIKMWNVKLRDQKYSIKCTPIDHQNADDHEEDDDSTPLQVSSRAVATVSILEQGKSEPSPQGQFGTVYNPGSYMVFNIQTLEPEATGFQLDFYQHCEGSETQPRHVGYSFILPPDIRKSLDSKVVPISSMKHKPLGQIQLDFLLVKPLIGQKFNMEVSFQNYWKLSRPPLDIGHRGMGTSYDMKQLASIPENTVHSLQEAASHGADMVELDIHLTKDKKVVIYHDFKVKLAYRKKKQGELELLEVPVKDLKLSELHSMRLWHRAKPETMDEVNQDDLDPLDLQPFPTLERCLEVVDKHTGFNIEVKYPQMLQDSTHEQDNYFDLNEFLDIILAEVYKHHGGRRIVFSTFDCNTCIALRLKQNRYPVLFLSQADTSVYPKYRDHRTLTIPMAAEFCITHGLLGVNAFSERLLQDMSLIDLVKSRGLVLWTWGEDNNNSDMINKFKQYKVDAVIYDRIDMHKTTGKESIFKMEHNNKLLEKLSLSQVYNTSEIPAALNGATS